jgi:UPF0755 protein
MAIARARRQRQQRGGALKSIFLTLFVLGLLGAGAAGFVAYKAHQKIIAPGPLAESTVIWIKPGSGVSTMATQLEAEGVIASATLFKVAARVRDAQTRLQAGEYEIPAEASINDIIDILLEGKPFLHRITLPEGLTTRQILVLVNENDVLTGELTVEPAEGTLLPETYAFPRGETRDQFITRMMAAQTKTVDELWEARVEGLPIKTKEEAIILASIVEKETGQSSERARVAGVFINRLNKGMRLQSDPTIIYGITGGEPLGRGIRQSELRGATPYNTYVISGLTPTPICNPGKDSIAAVLNPEDNGELFFVADGTGGHAFSKTLREHEANVRKWRQIERAQRNQAGQ